MEHAADDPAAGYTGEDYAEHVRTEFSTYRWLLEPMLAVAGFEIVTVDFGGKLYGAYTCVKSGASPMPPAATRSPPDQSPEVNRVSEPTRGQPGSVSSREVSQGR